MPRLSPILVTIQPSFPCQDYFLTNANLTVCTLCKSSCNALGLTHGFICGRIQGGVVDVAKYCKRDNFFRIYKILSTLLVFATLPNQNN